MGKIDRKTDGDLLAQAKLKMDASQDILQRLRDMDVMESRSAHFCQKLRAHFDRLPASYAMKVKFDGIKAVLKHIKLLDLAKTSANCPAIDVCEVEVHPSDEEINRSTRPLYEVTCATTNKSELFFHFTAVLDLMNLRIKEISVLSTTDGYSLLVSVVTGVPQRLEKPDQLCKALRKEFLKADQDAGLRRIDQPERPRYVTEMLQVLLFDFSSGVII